MTPEEKQHARQQIKRQLGEYLAKKREAEHIRERLTEVEARIMAPRSSKLDGMPRGGQGSDLSDKVQQHLALKSAYESKLAALSRAQLEVEDMIDGLPTVDRNLLRYRYIDGLAWEEVCVRMAYSWRQTHNIHARAIDKLAGGKN